MGGIWGDYMPTIKHDKSKIYDGLVYARDNHLTAAEAARYLQIPKSTLHGYMAQFGIRLNRQDFPVIDTATDSSITRAINFLWEHGYTVRKRQGADYSHFMATRKLRAVSGG
jgi:hypothetical protein